MRTGTTRIAVLTAGLSLATWVGAAPSALATQTHTYIGGVEVPSGSGFASDDYAGDRLAVDRDGGQHAILWDTTTGFSYATRLPGETTFTVTPADYAVADSVGIVRTVSGDAIDVVVTTCDDIEVFEIPASQRTLPTLSPDAAALEVECSDNDHDEGHYPPAIDGMTSLADGQIAMLVEYDKRFYLGLPGASFTPMPLPKTNADITGFRLCGDAAGDRVYVAEALFNNTLALDILSKARGTWRWTATKPLNVGARTFNADSRLTSIAASHLHVWVTVFKHGHPLISHRTPKGAWSRLTELPGGVNRSTAKLVARPDTSKPEVWVINNDNDGRSDTNAEERHYVVGSGWGRTKTTEATFVWAAAIGWQGPPLLAWAQEED